MKRLGLLITLALLCSRVWADVIVDQVGYRPQDPKAFVTNSGTVPFEVVSLDTGQVALAGKTSQRRKSDPATGMDLYWGDFSTVRDEGTYRVRLQDGSESFSFDIRSDVYTGVANSALKSYFLQRCGVPLKEPWACLLYTSDAADD